MRRLHYVIALISAVCFMLASVPFAVSASDTDSFEFSLNEDNTLSVTKYNGNDKDVIIPSAYNGRSVTIIGEQAFAKNLLETVTFPDTLTTIQKQAFESCIYLKEVNLPESVTSVMDMAFLNCDSLTNVEATYNLQYIGSQAFDNTRMIIAAPSGPFYIGRNLYRYIGFAPTGTVVTVSDYTASISPRAFEGQHNITECYIPVGLRTIGDYAFANCSNLTIVRIPPSVSSMGKFIFSNTGMVTIHSVTDSSAHRYAIENTSVYFNADPTLDYLDGDMDKDGMLSSTDIRILMNALIRSVDCDHERYLSCDIVYDGKIATSDIREWLILSIS